MTSGIAGKISGDALPDPPEGLSGASVALWREVVAGHPFHLSELPVLESGLRARDRAEQAAAIVEREGLTVTTESTGAVRPHPACAIEMQARKEFRLVWSRLGLIDATGGK